MNLKSLICYVALGILLMSSGIVASCDSFNEDLPECRLSVKFKYDYNMEFADAFHAQVDKVELYVFDKNGKYLFKQAEEGSALSTGNYLMEVELPVGQYQFMAWAGARDSYDITSLTPGVSTLTDLKLKLNVKPLSSSIKGWKRSGMVKSSMSTSMGPSTRLRR